MSRILLGKYVIECPDEGCSKAIIRKARRQGAIDALNSDEFRQLILDAKLTELDEIEKRFEKVSEMGFATPKLAIEYVGFIIKKRQEELRK